MMYSFFSVFVLRRSSTLHKMDDSYLKRVLNARIVSLCLFTFRCVYDLLYLKILDG